MKVRFNDVKEFLAELEAETGEVEDSILRLTRRFTRNTNYPQLQTVQVVATCLIRRKLVALEEFVGEVMGGLARDETNDKTAERASAIISLIEAEAKRLDLEIRRGVFME